MPFSERPQSQNAWPKAPAVASLERNERRPDQAVNRYRLLRAVAQMTKTSSSAQSRQYARPVSMPVPPLPCPAIARPCLAAYPATLQYNPLAVIIWQLPIDRLGYFPLYLAWHDDLCFRADAVATASFCRIESLIGTMK